ncbi:MAG TPA: hypothetical protein VIX73_00990 [Kofleriaceae bacterium]
MRQAVVELDIDDLAPDHIIAFPHHREKVRSNSVATRNARLAAVHVFARFVATNHPEHWNSASGSSPSHASQRGRAWSSISRPTRSQPEQFELFRARNTSNCSGD